jgi:pyruvate kinase
MTRTKIICTIGPMVISLEKILQLMTAGMDIARLNFSHGTHEEHAQAIALLKEARAQINQPLAIMLDTKGPEIRLGRVPKGGIEVHPGSKIVLSKSHDESDGQHIALTPAFILDSLSKGTRLLIDNGYISAHVIEQTPDGVTIEIENQGVIHSLKGINVPNVQLNLPALTAKDVTDIRFGLENDIDIIAASFVRSADHVLSIKRLLAEEKRSDALVIAKIENNEGVHNFDSILQVADGIMIARGDLGVEVPLSQVPRLQKLMLRKSYLAGKPTVTATQMLESMIHNPRPTRAEVSDVANAIHDGTSCVMLSGETAIGKYPIECVQIMRSIIAETEVDFHYQEFFDQHTKLRYNDVPSAVTLATVKTAYSLDARAIFAFTHSGSTARLLSRLRPHMPIIALTPNENTYHQLALIWGVIPVRCHDCTTIDQAFKQACDFALNNHFASYGDVVVLTTGSPLWVPRTTNTILVESIGEVLVRGQGGSGARLHGNVTLVPTVDSKPPYAVRDQIIVVEQLDEAFFPLVRESIGVILQNHSEDIESEHQLALMAKALQKPYIMRAEGAFRVLREGQLVTLDPEKALIYKGVVK